MDIVLHWGHNVELFGLPCCATTTVDDRKLSQAVETTKARRNIIVQRSLGYVVELLVGTRQKQTQQNSARVATNRSVGFYARRIFCFGNSTVKRYHHVQYKNGDNFQNKESLVESGHQHQTFNIRHETNLGITCTS